MRLASNSALLRLHDTALSLAARSGVAIVEAGADLRRHLTEKRPRFRRTLDIAVLTAE